MAASEVSASFSFTAGANGGREKAKEDQYRSDHQPEGGPQPGPQKLFTRVRKAVLLMGEELLIPQSMSHCLAPFIVRNTNVMMLESVRLL